jgi:uncharacterized membrane protein
MRPTTIFTVTAALSGLLAASSPAMAVTSSYIFTTIVVPGSLPGTTGDFGLGINDPGQIVGDFTDNAGTHIFLDTRGNFTTINPLGDTFTTAVGINSRGQILGQSSSTGNFVYAHGTFTPIANLPGLPLGINDLGQIVGGDSSGPDGFLYTRGRITTYAVPGASVTAGTGINDSGQIVGQYLDSTGFHSFLDTRGVLTNIEVPGAQPTLANGINERARPPASSATTRAATAFSTQRVASPHSMCRAHPSRIPKESTTGARSSACLPTARDFLALSSQRR